MESQRQDLGSEKRQSSSSICRTYRSLGKMIIKVIYEAVNVITGCRIWNSINYTFVRILDLLMSRAY